MAGAPSATPILTIPTWTPTNVGRMPCFRAAGADLLGDVAVVVGVEGGGLVGIHAAPVCGRVRRCARYVHQSKAMPRTMLMVTSVGAATRKAELSLETL